MCKTSFGQAVYNSAAHFVACQWQGGSWKLWPPDPQPCSCDVLTATPAAAESDAQFYHRRTQLRLTSIISYSPSPLMKHNAVLARSTTSYRCYSLDTTMLSLGYRAPSKVPSMAVVRRTRTPFRVEIWIMQDSTRKRHMPHSLEHVRFN